MSATGWLIVAIVGFSLAGIAFIAAIFMFIKMNIPAIVGDLTGKTVAREIKAMRDANEATGDKRFRSSKVNMERGTLTEKVGKHKLDTGTLKKAHASKRLDKATDELGNNSIKKGTGTAAFTYYNVQNSYEGSNPTEALSTNATEVLSSNATEVLSEGTTLLSEGTTLLSEGTTVLNETTVLSQTEKLDEMSVIPVSFIITRNEIVTHSNEVI